jgi:hypothetical protein
MILDGALRELLHAIARRHARRAARRPSSCSQRERRNAPIRAQRAFRKFCHFWVAKMPIYGKGRPDFSLYGKNQSCRESREKPRTGF